MSDESPVGIYAHTDPEFPGETEKWEPLFSEDCAALRGDSCEKCETLDRFHGHLNKVAWWTGKFAEEMFPAGSEEAKAAREWGYLAGLWHDLGKFAPEFQKLLKGEISRANHSTAGAQHAYEQIPVAGQFLAYAIAGHHAGLTDLIGGDSSLMARLTGEDYLSRLPRRLDFPTQAAKSLAWPIRTRQAGALASFNRLLFSCLVDADFLATEAFMNQSESERRFDWPGNVIDQMTEALGERYAQFDPITSASPEINRRRATVHADCVAAAERKPGLFTLTVPTGGGKTLASLAFALRHAKIHGMQRVIFVVPYTSIIEQNASEYRETFVDLSAELGRDIVLEHHSNFEPVAEEDRGNEKPLWRLAAENWDAPLVVTTSVQFFESFYANRTSRCRKLHRMARSVVIFDEAQTLPPDFLAPCLDTLRHLTKFFGSTAVLCTATQPALGKHPDGTSGSHAKKWNRIALDLGEKGSREIVRDVDGLFSHLARTRIEHLGALDDEQLAERLRGQDRILCILNTKPHAARVFEKLGAKDSANLHLSAQLSPAHRADILREINRREKEGEPCRVIATTVVEAGVDLDFPVVYRALTGLDSLAQAAGRCNRHGKLGERGGQVFLFTSTAQKTPSFLTHSVNAAASVLPDYQGRADDLILPEAIESYFRQFYFEKDDWDREKIGDCFDVANDSSAFPFLFNFKTAAKRFRLIPDNQLPVIIEPKPGLWPDLNTERYSEIRALINAIREANRFGRFPPGNAHRRLQRHTVQIPKSIHAAMVATGKIELFCDDRFPVLVHPENDYDKNLGLKLPDHADLTSAFLI